MGGRLLRRFGILVLCGICANAAFTATVSPQEVEQGGTGEGVEGDVSEAAESYKLGLLLDEQGDHAGALGWFLSAAERGHASAVYRVARAYAEGRGTTRDDKLAVPFYRKAAKMGHVGAIGGLGLMHFSGRGGLEKSAAKAETLFRQAAQRGNAQAMYNLGNLYARGSGDVAKNLAEAYVLLEIASQKGVSEALPLAQSVEGQLSLAQRSEIAAARTQWKNSIKE